MARARHEGTERLSAPIQPGEFDDSEIEFQRCRELWIAKLQLYARAILSGKGGYGMTPEEAVAWLEHEDFFFTCEMLGLNPNVVRRSLLVSPKDPAVRNILRLRDAHAQFHGA